MFGADQSEAMLQAVLGRDATETPIVPLRRMPWRRVAAAAVLAGGLGWGAWWWAHLSTPAPLPPQVAKTEKKPLKEEVIAGGNKAVLILDNGSAVTLDSARTGLLTTQGATQVVKLGGGRLAYNGGAGGTAKNGTPESTILYNTVRTPRGGQYQVTRIDLVTAGVPNGTCNNGAHSALSAEPFGLTVWGWDTAVSYAFPAGMSTLPINTVQVPPSAQ